MELSHTIQGKAILDAAILLVNMPDGESMEYMREYLKTLFQDVRPAEGLAETEYGESISETQQPVGPDLAIHL